MIKQVSLVVLSVLVVFNTARLFAQEVPAEKDTFFLSKKKGLLGKLGKSISVDPPVTTPVKTANPFLNYSGKCIRFIEIMSLGFERNIYDTSRVRQTFSIVLANAFHKNTRDKIILHNLFFREGDKLNPYLFADNERHLRALAYIQDARILVTPVPGSTDSVDVIVISKDVFSIGGIADVSGVNKARVGLKEANLGGSGSQLGVTALYESTRNPHYGWGMELIKRNIGGSFIDWTTGFQTYKAAFNSGRNEELYLYTHFERPLVTLYIPWIGAADLSYSKTQNLYLPDSVYKSDYNYGYYLADAWVGYNIGSKNLLSENTSNRVRQFVSLRGFYQRFNELPQKNELVYDYRYANISGVLVAFSLFKQEFYRTNFIYGFGINEDVPEGFSGSILGGITEKYDRTRPYYGIESLLSHYSKKGSYTSYTFRFGGYSYQNKWEDVALLLGIDHFTKLKKLGPRWFNRNFYSAYFAQQVQPVLNQPLFLRSMFGLPYYDANYFITGDVRGTLKGETVFYNMKKFWGFRMAPFAFYDMCAIRPVNRSYKKTELYSAWGAGVRTRNENLIFGTIELRCYVYTRPIEGMKAYKVELTTGIRFKYNSTVIRKPDFVNPN